MRLVDSLFLHSGTDPVCNLDVEDKGVAKCDTLGGGQNLVFINESGLYALILSSKLPQAKAFKRWVTSEVLPSIRQTGRYELPQQLPALALLNEPAEDTLTATQAPRTSLAYSSPRRRATCTIWMMRYLMLQRCSVAVLKTQKLHKRNRPLSVPATSVFLGLAKQPSN